ncbi:MAG: hypothetical protein KZQ58_09060 [gamma proteobacterium symbiont of Bathyaustriella thionipta]|nr:hypothetical protein [gamma proteobacterium symbiont of Bathyaustriella thionipta]
MFIGILILLALVGCKAIDEKKQADKLKYAIYSFEGAARWSYFDKMAQFYVPKKGEIIEVPLAIEKVRVTDYKVIQPLVMSPDESEGTQMVELVYVFDDEQVIRRTRFVLPWFWDEKVKNWRLRPPFPEFPRN